MTEIQGAIRAGGNGAFVTGAAWCTVLAGRRVEAFVKQVQVSSPAAKPGKTVLNVLRFFIVKVTRFIANGSVKLLSSRNLIAAGLLVFAVIVAWCFWLSAWLRADESALDYSGLAIELGPADSEVNGYSLIREFADDYEDSLDESYENVFFTERADWNLARMKDVVNQRQKLLEAFEAGFRQEIFKFDQPISPATLVPEVGDFRRFVQTKVLEARIAELAGRPGDALQGLLELESNIVKYAGSGGGLINMLTAIACAQVLNEAVEDLLAHATLEVQALKAAQRNYDIGEWLTSSAQIAFRYEFHFACNSIDLILDSPEQLMGDFTQEKSLIAKWKNRKNRARMDYLFKVNQTK